LTTREQPLLAAQAATRILRRYLQVAPGARPHIPVDRRAPLVEFEQIAARYPVFGIRADSLRANESASPTRRNDRVSVDSAGGQVANGRRQSSTFLTFRAAVRAELKFQHQLWA